MKRAFLFLIAAAASAAAGQIREEVFRFYPYIARYQIWEFRPLDQGLRLVQLQIIRSERDDDIVRAVRRPGFFNPWGNPINWDGLEKTEIEKCVWLNR